MFYLATGGYLAWSGLKEIAKDPEVIEMKTGRSEWVVAFIVITLTWPYQLLWKIIYKIFGKDK